MPVLYMMFSVLSWSLFPLLGAWGIDQVGVFEYIFWTYMVGGITAYGLWRFTPGYAETWQTAWRLDRKLLGEIFVGCLTVLLSLACLLSSFFYISKAGATIIFEVWPIIAMYLTPLLIQRGWEKISKKDMAFSCLAFIGVGFLMFPELTRSGQPFFSSLGAGYHVFLPLLGGLFMAISSAMKARISHHLQNPAYPIASLLQVQLYFSIGVVVLAIPFIIFWPGESSIYTPQNIAALAITGLFILTLGSVSYTMAVLRSTKSNIVVLWYLMPIFSVIWLVLAGESQITPAIVLGSIFIITANLIMTIKADDSLAYLAAVMMMLFCGVYVYYIEGLAMADYFQAISVPIVFYTILIAFIMDRTIRSDTLEELRAIEIINFIDDHAKALQHGASHYTQHVVAIVSTNQPSQFSLHYQALRNPDEAALRPIYNQIDELVASKVRGTSFAEVFILLLIALLIVVTALVFRPPSFVGDAFGIVISLTVMFIFFTVLDLQNQRRHFYLQRDENGHRHLSTEVTDDLYSERVLSAVLIVAIMSAFIGLMIMKRYPGLG